MGRGKVGSLYLGIRELWEDVVSAFSVGKLRQEREGGEAVGEGHSQGDGRCEQRRGGGGLTGELVCRTTNPFG